MASFLHLEQMSQPSPNCSAFHGIRKTICRHNNETIYLHILVLGWDLGGMSKMIPLHRQNPKQTVAPRYVPVGVRWGNMDWNFAHFEVCGEYVLLHKFRRASRTKCSILGHFIGKA